MQAARAPLTGGGRDSARTAGPVTPPRRMGPRGAPSATRPTARASQFLVLRRGGRRSLGAHLIPSFEGHLLFWPY
jgi:hypothetical protein